ncbi:MAG: hypothetical protein QW559_02145 [Candidatus Woesearchaeota archaeon]
MAKKRSIVELALAEAKKIEPLIPHSRKKIFREYTESLETAAKLQKLLRPVWYLGKERHKIAHLKPRMKARKSKG